MILEAFERRNSSNKNLLKNTHSFGNLTSRLKEHTQLPATLYLRLLRILEFWNQNIRWIRCSSEAGSLTAN